MLKVASFFAGIGGFDLGFEQAGMEVVFQCEINPFCQKVLKKHWPTVELHGDIKKISPGNIPKSAQVWCGGFPCQDLSLANQGKRKGLEGDRSGLFYQYAELIAYHKPRWIVIENVPGLLNSHQGVDFRILLEKLDEFGYGLSWRVFDAKYFGTPQRHRRVYFVGSLGSLGSAQVLFESEPFAIPRWTGRNCVRNPCRSICKKTLQTQINLFSNMQASDVSHQPDFKPKAGATTAKATPSTAEAVPMLSVRRLMPSECEMLQSFPKG